MHSSPPYTAAICTIVANNYLAQARCLAESFHAQHPGGRMFVLLVDPPGEHFRAADEPFSVVHMHELAIPRFEQMAFRYTVLELSTAVKPFLIEHLFEHAQLDRLIYLDPDIVCYRPLTPLLDALEGSTMALTPHLLEPLDDHYRPSELDILRAGAYNLGCIGLARTPDLLPFLRWWQRRLERDCVVDLSHGLFVDQRWIDLAPSLFGGVAIVRDPGCNVAFWNLSQRRISRGPGGWTVNGQPLTFYHFSGLDVDNIEHISVHQNRYTLAKLPELRELIEDYTCRMRAHGHLALRGQPYGYGRFRNGVAIPDLARQIWRTYGGEQRWATPFETGGPGSFFQWLNQEADPAANDGLLLSNLALEVYRRRVDLQQAFPDVLGAHRRPFIGWFIQDAAQQHRLDEALVAPMRQAWARLEAAYAAATPPGRWSTARRAWSGGAGRVRALLPPLPEERLVGKARLSRRLYYAVRNPLRRLGLHQLAKRVIGVHNATWILHAMVIRPARSTRMPQQHAPIMSAMPAPAPGLNLVGYLAQESGVGEVARALLRAVEMANYPVVGIQSPLSEEARLAAQAGPYLCNLLCVNADMTPQVQRALGATFFQQRYTIGLWHWETADFPLEWRDHCARLNELWVASDFVRETLAPLVPIPLHKVRLPIAIPDPGAVRRADLGLPDDRFVWLFAFDMHSYVVRKNPHAVVEAYRRAFGPRSSTTQLVIKARHLADYPEAAAHLRADVESVGGTLIARSTSRAELSGLFAACDGYISLHRCEGFGMTMAEAMALGKPVVATAYSGNMDFMTADNSYLVRHRLSPLDGDHGPYRRGTLWADPDLDDAAAHMRDVYERRDEAQRRGAAAAADIARWYGSLPVGQSLVERLKSIESQL